MRIKKSVCVTAPFLRLGEFFREVFLLLRFFGGGFGYLLGFLRLFYWVFFVFSRFRISFSPFRLLVRFVGGLITTLYANVEHIPNTKIRCLSKKHILTTIIH